VLLGIERLKPRRSKERTLALLIFHQQKHAP
jgi:hypothetical protein